MHNIGLHHAHYHGPRLSELGRLYWAHSIGVLAGALANILVPIYLLKIGYSLSDVFLFYVVVSAVAIGFVYLTVRFLGKIGANRAMAAGNAFHIITFLSLALLPGHHLSLLVPAMLWAATRGVYWPAFHANFSKSRAHEKSGREVGGIIAIVQLAGGIAPGIGGVIASLYGINMLYGISIGLFVGAIIVLLSGPEVIRHNVLRLGRLDWRKILPDLTASFSYTFVTAVEMAIWPLLIFFIIPSYAGVGLLSSVVVLSSMAIALFVGRREERRGERHYIKRGTTVSALSHALRLFASTTLHVFGINLVGGAGHSVLATSYLNRYYKHSDEESRLAYIFAMESAHLFGWLIIFVFLYLMAIVISGTQAMLLLVALAIPLSFGVRLIR